MTTVYIADGSPQEELFKKHLLAIGLLTKVIVRVPAPKGNREPINVKGKPLSLSIIEARR
jgi:hypothetical protein